MADIDLITHVDRGTAMGDLLRRYWIPALLAEELPEPDGDPKALRLLGEDLVAFRDTSGRVGIMDVQCPHRLASLALGRNEKGGLRCLYHGWKIDVDGKVLDMPCEPPTSRFKDRFVHASYPVREHADIIWVYMGPESATPPLPDFNWTRVQSSRRVVGKLWEKCNFIQGMEGVFDSFHSNLLHSGFEVLGWTPEQISKAWPRPSRATYGTISAESTSYGYHYAAVREPTEQPDLYDYVRITEYIAPFYCINPPDLGLKSAGFMFVPIDDHNTMLYQVIASEADERAVDRDHARRLMAMQPGEDLDENFRPLRNETNGFGQDRVLMRAGVAPDASTDLRKIRNAFSGINTGIQTQDMAMVETMGPISDRTKEHLGASDIGVVHFRERIVEAVKTFQAGGEPPALDPAIEYHRIGSVGAIVQKGTDWRQAAWSSSDGPHEWSEASSVIGSVHTAPAFI
jgi:phthalate 4,5-dioxygenase oxygenase subunit